MVCHSSVLYNLIDIMPNRNTAIVGTSGEFYVAHILSRSGYVVSLSPAKTPYFDLLVSNQEGSRFAGIQIKSRWWAENAGRIEFPLPRLPQERLLSTKGSNIFCVFVDLHGGWERTNSGEQPKCYVATKRDLDNYCKNGVPNHWLNFRVPLKDAKRYLDKWHKITRHLGPGWPET